MTFHSTAAAAEYCAQRALELTYGGLTGGGDYDWEGFSSAEPSDWDGGSLGSSRPLGRTSPSLQEASDPTQPVPLKRWEECGQTFPGPRHVS